MREFHRSKNVRARVVGSTTPACLLQGHTSISKKDSNVLLTRLGEKIISIDETMCVIPLELFVKKHVLRSRGACIQTP